MTVKSVWQRKGLARSHAVGRPSLAVWPASGHLRGPAGTEELSDTTRARYLAIS